MTTRIIYTFFGERLTKLVDFVKEMDKEITISDYGNIKYRIEIKPDLVGGDMAKFDLLLRTIGVVQ